MATKQKDRVLLGVELTDEQIETHKTRFAALSPIESRMAAMLAHGVNWKKICEILDINPTDFYRRRSGLLRVLGCNADQLPLVVLSALGVVKTHAL